MINKMVTKEINRLKEKIEELEIENKRIKQDSVFKSETIKDLNNANEELEGYIDDLAAINRNLEKENRELTAELTYWKETAENWKDLYKEADSGLQYLKTYSSNLEKALNNSNKSVDN